MAYHRHRVHERIQPPCACRLFPYPTVGPFLAKRAIAKELGGPIYDDDGKMWFLARENGVVVGFATLLLKGSILHLEEVYVLPTHRYNGIHTRLIDERLKYCPPGSTVQVLVNASSIDQYKARGFTEKRKRGKSWTELVKVIGNE